jgi:GT2 family glycosyltransferase
MQPVITVLTATYNRPQLLREAVQSILAQTFADFELIVINDGGQDVSEILASFKDRRIIYLNLPENNGKAHALNCGIDIARGKYCAYLDDDDHFFPHHLATLLTELEAHPEIDLVYSDFEEVLYSKEPDGSRREIERSVTFSSDFDRTALLKMNYIPHPTILHRKEILDAYGHFDESYPCLIDWELFHRLAFYCEFRHLKRVTGEYFINRDKGDHITNLHNTERDSYMGHFHRIRRQLPPRPWKYVEATPTGLRVRPKLEPSRDSSNSYLVSIIIPVRNKVDLTRQCLASIRETHPVISHEIIIVDNASDDGSREFLQALAAQKEITYLRNDPPQPFATSCNRGAHLAKGKYLLFLNNDTVALPGWLEELVRVAESAPDIGAVGAKLLYPDGTIQHAGVAFHFYTRWNNVGPYHIFRKFPAGHPAVIKQREFNAVTGACLLTPQAVFINLGGFDERYINCFEDVDYCLHLRSRGYRIIYTPKAELVHFEGQTEGRNDNVRRSFLVLQEKWGSRLSADEGPYLSEEGLIIEENDEKTLYLLDINEFRQWKEAICQILDLHQWLRASEELEQLEKLVGTNKPDILEMRGRWALGVGDGAGAWQSFNRAHKLDLGNAGPKWGLVQAALAQSKPLEARTRLRRLMADHPDDPRQGQWRKTLEEIRGVQGASSISKQAACLEPAGESC